MNEVEIYRYNNSDIDYPALSLFRSKTHKQYKTGTIMKGIMFKEWKPKLIREWQTRRISGLKEINQEPSSWLYKGLVEGKHYFEIPETTTCHLLIESRYQVGDIVFIREAWAAENQYNHLKPSEIPHTTKIFYVSDGYDPFTMGRVRSPLFMMEWMARTFVRITGVRPERLQAITPEDIEAEGVLPPNRYGWLPDVARLKFQLKWDSINPQYPFSGNFWVWVYTFVRLDK